MLLGPPTFGAEASSTTSSTTGAETGAEAGSKTTADSSSEKKVAVPHAAEDYKDQEFEPWVRDLRRAEIIAVGAFPIAYLFAGLGYDYYYYLANGFPQDNIPWPVGPGTSRWVTTSQPTAVQNKNLVLIGTSVVAGVILAGLDWWLGR